MIYIYYVLLIYKNVNTDKHYPDDQAVHLVEGGVVRVVMIDM